MDLRNLKRLLKTKIYYHMKITNVSNKTIVINGCAPLLLIFFDYCASVDSFSLKTQYQYYD